MYISQKKANKNSKTKDLKLKAQEPKLSGNFSGTIKNSNNWSLEEEEEILEIKTQ